MGCSSSSTAESDSQQSAVVPTGGSGGGSARSPPPPITAAGILSQSGTTITGARPTHHGNHSHPSLTLHAADCGSPNSSEPPTAADAVLPLRSNSLMRPDSHADLTASARKRSSIRTAGQSKREIPPKIPVVRKSTVGERGVLDAAQFPHAAAGSVHVANTHGGHHGYGPGNLAGDAVEPIDADASTQKINSDTGALGIADSPAGAGPPAHSHPHHHHHHHHHTGGPRKRLRRQTSHRGLLSRLALQFPYIKASFQKVHNVFERYHQERVQLILAQQAAKKREALAAANASVNSSRAKVADLDTTVAFTFTTDANGPAFMTPEAAHSPSSISSTNGTDSGHSSSRQKKLTKMYLAEEISLDKLSEVLQHISGSTKTFTDEEVRDLFKLADLDGSKTISFKEFLIAVSIGYFLKIDASAFAAADEESNALSLEAYSDPAVVTSAPSPDPPLTRNLSAPTDSSSSTVTPSSTVRRLVSARFGTEFIEIQKGFKMVEKAFMDIDEDGSQSVDVSELKKALFATSGTKDQSILELRFQELDFNGDGDINFPEWIHGLACWVGMDDDIDEYPAPSPP